MRPVGGMASTDEVSEKCELRRARMFVVRFLYGFVVTGRISFSHTVWFCNCVLCFLLPVYHCYRLTRGRESWSLCRLAVTVSALCGFTTLPLRTGGGLQSLIFGIQMEIV